MTAIITPRPAVTVDPWGRVKYDKPQNTAYTADDGDVNQFVKKVNEFQEIVNDDRFRVHGRCVGSNWHIWLSTRLRRLMEDKDSGDAMTKLRRNPIEIPGYGSRPVHVETLLTCPFEDVEGVLVDELKSGGIDWADQVGRKIEGFETDAEGALDMHTSGPDHNKTEEIVDVFVDVTPLLNRAQLESAVLALRTHTQQLWESNHCLFLDNLREVPFA